MTQNHALRTYALIALKRALGFVPDQTIFIDSVDDVSVFIICVSWEMKKKLSFNVYITYLIFFS